MLSGNQFLDRSDISLDAGTWTLDIAPHFSAQFQTHTVHGFGWHSVLGMRLFRNEGGGFSIRDANGLTTTYPAKLSTDTYPATLRPSGNVGTNNPLLLLSANGPFVYRDGTRRHYFGSDGALDSITDGNGFGFRMVYDSLSGVKLLAPISGISTSAQPSDFRAIVARDYRVNRIENLRKPTYGLTMHYDTAGFLDTLSDHAGRGVRYVYDHDSTLKVGRLVQVRNLEGSFLYNYQDAAHPHTPTQWNAEPIAPGKTIVANSAQTGVAFTNNTLGSDGRVATQSTADRKFTWAVTSNTANTFISGTQTCSGRKTVITQTTTTSQDATTEVLTDTAYACVPTTWNSTEPAPVTQGGKQWSSLGGRIIDYGRDEKSTSTLPYPFPFVNTRNFPDKIAINTRDSLGQDTLTIEVSSTAPFDTLYTHRKLDSEGRTTRETRFKRYVAQSNNALDDSNVVSTNYDSQGRTTQELRWNNPADSSQGTTVKMALTYNTDGTINTETTADGQTITYDYSQSTYPGKPNSKTYPGTVTHRYTHTALGQIATQTDPRLGVTRHWYTASGKDSITVTPALDTTYSIWEGTRLVRKIANRKGPGTGRETVMKYNPDGLDTATYIVEGNDTSLVTRTTRDAFGRVTVTGDALKSDRSKTGYNALGYAEADTSFADQANTVKITNKRTLDAMGRTTAELLANSDSVSYRLDGQNNKLATRHFVKTGTTRVQVSADSSIYSYDNQVLVRLDSLGAGNWLATKNIYDNQGNLKRSIGSRLDTTLYGYSESRLQWSRDPVGKWTWHVKDGRGFDSIAVTLAKGNMPDTASGTYTPQAGDYVQHTMHDDAGNTRRVRQGTWQAGNTKAEDLPLVRATGYYPSGRVQSDSVPVDLVNGKWLETTYEWYPTGEVKKTSRTGGISSSYIYNAQGIKLADLALNAQGMLDTVRTYSYDAAGRLIEERTPGSGSTVRIYDESGRVTSVTDSSGVTSKYGYDGLGKVVADTNGLGFVSTTTAILYQGLYYERITDRNGGMTHIGRDPLGRTRSISDPSGNVTWLFYESKTDGTERDSIAYPDGTWEVTVTDKGGRTLQKLDKRGVTQSFIYGNDWTANTVRYEMATKPTLEINYTRNAKGQVEKIERTEGGTTTAMTEYTFDDAGRVLSQKQSVGSDIKTTSYAYDMTRRSVTLTLPDGTTRAKVLDERGRLDSVYLDGAMVADYLYDNNKHTGTVLGNGIEATYGRDVAGRLTSMAYGKNGQDPIVRHDLGWDVAGELKWTKKTPDAIADERYGMDKQGQLTEWKTGILNAANEILTPVDSLGWAMDSRGNWTNVYDSKATVDTRTHSGANAINVRNGVTFVYDDAGNLLSDGAKTYEWTLDGMLAKVTSAVGITSYIYDAQRRLVKRTELDTYGAVKSTTSMLYDGWQLAQEVRTTSMNTETRTYTYGRYIDDVLAVRVAGGSTPGTYYYHQGYNHDVEAITNATGAVVERYSVKPYGEFSVSTDGADGVPGTVDDGYYTQSIIGNNIVFQSRPFDAASGLYDFRNRQYSATLGRFISRDPAGVFANKGFNLYQAFDENPMMNLDPLGLLTARDGLSHYLDGSGTDLGMGFDELSIDGVDGAWWGVKGPKPKSGSCCEERTVNVSQTKSYGFDKNKHSDQWALLGNITLKLTGSMKISQNCACSFSGQMSALPDYYDFNESTHRGLVGETATTYGRMLGAIWDGKSFYIQFNGTRPLQFNCGG